jgi:RNase P protein component
MLKKINRITSKKEFEEIKSKGEMKATELFSVVWMKKTENRAFGAIISKRFQKRQFLEIKLKED